MSPAECRHHALSLLRESIGDSRPGKSTVLPFGIDAIDGRLADGGLMLGGLHEVSPATATLSDDAAATLFTVGIAARAAAQSRRRVLWALTRFDLYAPGLEQAGLDPATLLFVEAREDKEVLAVMEDGLRHGGLAAVVGEVKRADMVATRRLQLAAMTGGTPALLARRWRKVGTCPLGELSAAMTRWRIACAPSARLPAPGVGRARWTVELARQRGGPGFTMALEACDDTGRLALPAAPRDRTIAAAGAAARAA
ncbi:protein ImuA [Sphingomonas sp. 1185]|uniref:ImuA family protein n=1 Tax=Sphingomonas sp. 1185 TaxID=3156411 RepID=UPI003393E479